MPRRSPALERATHGPCPLGRSLGALSDPWSFLILREVFRGRRTFSEFREELDIATTVLTDRLRTLVDYGILRLVPYHEPGERTRSAYEPTPAGAELKVALTALLQWGDAYTRSDVTRPRAVTTREGARVEAQLVDADGRPLPVSDVVFTRPTSEP